MTKTREKVLAFLRRYIAAHGWSPTYSEIGKEVGISVNAVRKHIVGLEHAGFLSMEPNRTGRIRMTSPAPDGWTREQH